MFVFIFIFVLNSDGGYYYYYFFIRVGLSNNNSLLYLEHIRTGTESEKKKIMIAVGDKKGIRGMDAFSEITRFTTIQLLYTHYTHTRMRY